MLDSAVRSFSEGALKDASGVLAVSRHATITDAGGSIPKLAVNKFIEVLLPTQLAHAPKPTEKLVPLVMQRLKKRKNYAHRRWKAFPSDPKSADSEKDIFENLEKVVEAIQNAFEDVCQRDQESTTILRMDPDQTPIHIHRKTATRPDGAVALRHGKLEGGLHWVDIAACGEFKRKDRLSELNDDINKTLWNLHHLMREDPRRRFTYAFTIENRTMRLWFSNRSTYAVSEPFDFMTKPEPLVHFFLSLLYASETQLGWDPTMKLVVVDGRPQYDITVRDKDGNISIYRTSELLSNIATFNVRGRGTRVWKARLLVDGKPTGADVAIRDNWIDHDRIREADVLQQIIQDVPEDAVDPQDQGEHDPHLSRKLLCDHMLTVLTSGDVMIDGEQDRSITVYGTHTFETFNLVQADTSREAIRKRHEEARSRQAEVKGYHMTVHDMSAAPRKANNQYSMKAHYRIVYKEVCAPLSEVDDLKDIFRYLLAAAKVLQIVHSAGWVHRDISAGNILVADGKIKLADFEYAKKCLKGTSTDAHDVRTGTASFMSIEVAEQDYAFEAHRLASLIAADKPVRNPRTIDVELPERGLQDSQANIASSSSSEQEPEPWRYNPLHDTESLWWLGAFFLLEKDIVLVRPSNSEVLIPKEFLESKEDREDRLLLQNDSSVPIFQGLDRVHRYKLLKDNRCFFRLAEKILHPCLRGDLIDALDGLREDLVRCYTNVELNVSEIDHTAALHLYSPFQRRLMDAAVALNYAGFQIKIRSLGQVIEEENIQEKANKRKPKRSREDADDDAVTDTRQAGPSRSQSGKGKAKAKDSRKKTKTK